jgi:hypothetical protein
VRTVAIAENSDGVNLLRVKGGASPKALFSLVNGWITQKKTINARPGTVFAAAAPPFTVGGVGFENKIHVFAETPVASIDPLVVVDVLRHPTGGAARLKLIHKAFPFLGRLYVVAEFTDGVVKHYWLENPVAWSASKAYAVGSVVRPVTASGFYYENKTPVSYPAWQASTEVAIADKRQPTTVNGFVYTVTAVGGPAPHKTGNTEPVWPTTVGATVVERLYSTETPVPPGSPTPDPGTDGGGRGGTGDEYGPFPTTHPGMQF